MLLGALRNQVQHQVPLLETSYREIPGEALCVERWRPGTTSKERMSCHPRARAELSLLPSPPRGKIQEASSPTAIVWNRTTQLSIVHSQTCRIYLNSFNFKLLSFWMVCYVAVDNWNRAFSFTIYKLIDSQSVCTLLDSHLNWGLTSFMCQEEVPAVS